MSSRQAEGRGLKDMVNRDAMSQGRIMIQDLGAVGMMIPPTSIDDDWRIQLMKCLLNRHKGKGNQLTVKVRAHRHFHRHFHRQQLHHLNLQPEYPGRQ